MRLIRHLDDLQDDDRYSVATIGNFDGLHRGHKTILDALKIQASRYRKPGMVIIFEPQPREFFQPEKAPSRLLRLRDKLHLLKIFGIKKVLCLRFNQQLAALTAQQFFHDILVQKLRLTSLLVGDDFRFGHQRHGDFSLLKALGQQQGMAIQQAPSFILNGKRVSSSRIRDALEHGQLKQAAELLGRCYRIGGKVAYGRQLGRTLGFATANIPLFRRRIPLHGVYVVQAHWSAQQAFGVANIGWRPTLGGTHPLLEVHLFINDPIDLYGQDLQVDILHHLRPEQRFSSVDLLKDQIQKDVTQAKTWLQTNAVIYR